MACPKEQGKHRPYQLAAPTKDSWQGQPQQSSSIRHTSPACLDFFEALKVACISSPNLDRRPQIRPIYLLPTEFEPLKTQKHQSAKKKKPLSQWIPKVSRKPSCRPLSKRPTQPTPVLLSRYLAPLSQLIPVPNMFCFFQGITGSCFEKCVPKPGTSLSSSEKTCMSYCVEKYIASWNEVNGTYIRRLRQGAEGNH